MVGIMRRRRCYGQPTGCEGPIERVTHLLCHSIAKLKTVLTNTNTNTDADTKTAADTDTDIDSATDTS